MTVLNSPWYWRSVSTARQALGLYNGLTVHQFASNSCNITEKRNYFLFFNYSDSGGIKTFSMQHNFKYNQYSADITRKEINLSVSGYYTIYHELISHAHRNMFEILLNQTEIRLYLSFSDYLEPNGYTFGSK